MNNLDEETQDAWRRLMTFEEEMEELRYAWGKFMIVLLQELKAPVNFVVRCLLKICDWLS